MNGFIVWDENNKVFVEDKEFYLTSNNELITEYGKGNLVYINIFKAFNYIGLNDINNNKIYADCSIVEFEVFNISLNDFNKHKGYFTYDNERLCYGIYYLDSKEWIKFNVFNICNIKIIDTIQENKLGLIK